MPYPWLTIFITLSLAITLCYYRIWPLVVFFVLAGFLALFWQKRFFAFLNVLLPVFLAGAVFYTLVVPAPPGELRAAPSTVLQGEVKTFPSFDGQKTAFVLETQSKNTYLRNVQVFCFFSASVQKGDRVEMRGKLVRPSLPGNPGELNYRAHLEQKRVYYLFSASQPQELRVVEKARGFNALVNGARRHASQLFHTVLQEREAAVLQGMLLGITDEIEPVDYLAYQKSGIVHVFSVSGLHIGFLLLLNAWITSLLGFSRRGKLLFATTWLLFYASMVGWPPEVGRSVIMALLGLIAYYSGRENQLPDSLGLAGILILLLNPTTLFQISFQLTFMATLGLVYLLPLLKSKLGYRSRIWDAVLVPVCAQLAVLPLTAFHFNLFSPLSLLINIPVAYLSGGAVIAGFISLPLGAIHPDLASLFLYPAAFLLDAIQMLNQLFLAIPVSYLWVRTPGFLFVVLYYAGLWLLLAAFPGRFSSSVHGRTGILAMAVFFLVLLVPAGWLDRGKTELTFLDVGQGDAMLLKTPQGKFILIDGGGSEFSDIGRKKVLPYLHHRGIHHLLMVINTHPDIDHLQGLQSVVEEIPVQYLAIPASLADSPAYDTFKGEAQKKRTPIRGLKRGEGWALDSECRLIVYHPPAGLSDENNNEHSLVMLFKFRDFSALLTGDVNSQVLASLQREGLKGPVTVIKAPHHGSKNSFWPAFYQQLKPGWVVVSAGRDNRFGHPHACLLEELNRQRIPLLRTDRDGAVSFLTDGTNHRLQTAASRKGL